MRDVFAELRVDAIHGIGVVIADGLAQALGVAPAFPTARVGGMSRFKEVSAVR
jgi:hypothetical protein